MAGLDVLVLGSGAREHALAWRVARDESVSRVRIAPGNAGTAAVGRNVPTLNPNDGDAVARYAANERIGLVIVGPELPLASGVADALETALVPVAGPTRAAARLEWSKAYAKQQLRRAGIATADAVVFSDPDEAILHVRAADRVPVVKADWLAAGKGVVVPEDVAAAEQAIRSIFTNAPPGASVVLEERLSGEEVSVFALVCGDRVAPLGAARDYKRLLDADAGPNTGGMGSYAPVAGFDASRLEAAVGDIFEPLAWRMARDGTPYRGVLYAGLMLTADGPMVLEFNVRFGDPEAQALLPRIDGDLAQALLGVATNDAGLMQGSIAERGDAACAVVVAAEGYPDHPVAGRPIDNVEPATPGDDGSVLCFHGATRRARDGRYETTGGRVVTLVGRGRDLAAAREAAYRAVAGVQLEGAQHRTDVAAPPASPA